MDARALAVDLLNAGRGDLAERPIRDWLRQQPAESAAHALLSMALCLQHREVEALREAEEAVRLDPEDVWALQAHLEVLVRLGEGRSAVRAGHAAVTAAPTIPRFRGLLAAALLSQARTALRPRGLRRDALAVAESGLELDPEDPECLLQRAQALTQLGRHAEALATTGDALRRSPESSPMHAVHGMVLMRAGDRRLGERSVREALRIDPQDRFAGEQLGRSSSLAREAALAQHARDTAAVVLLGRRWRWAVLLTAALLAVAAAWNLHRAVTHGSSPFPGGLCVAYLGLALLVRGVAHVRYQPVLQELADSGLLTPREQRWARISLIGWIALSGVLVVWGLAE